MPRQKPGKSKQDYGTPRNFLDALEARFGKLDVDLACDLRNMKAPVGLTEEEDSLKVNWLEPSPRLPGDPRDLNLFLNPPFSRIDPWVAKCAEAAPLMRRGRILVLVPASMSSLWWEAHVRGFADRVGISRMIFDGTPPNPKTGRPDYYPKDLALLVYSAQSAITGGTDGFWPWRVQGLP